MKIVNLEIKNYRNLDGIEINFNEKINFIVGENNLGKSNLIDCLNIIFNGYSFKEEDFEDSEEPIKIFIELKLKEEEIGVFEDLFDPEDRRKVNIEIIQETPENKIEYFHKSGQKINYRWKDSINFIKYDSLRTPKKELNFDKNRGVGKFLSHVVKKHIENNEENFDYRDYLKEDKVNELVDYINGNLSKIEVFNDFSINADVNEELDDLLYKLIALRGKNSFEIEAMGYGVQFFAMVLLSILEKTVKALEAEEKDKKYTPVLSEEDGEKTVSTILGLDEPEIHLHPYMQRNLIKYISRIMENKDLKFSELLKNVCNVDKINGQIITVTHSPNIILNNYKQIIRFYKENENLYIISGNEINFEYSFKKHFLMNLSHIKEAFFSRCVILVEGISEVAAFKVFADRMEINIDRLGITVVQAGGADSVPSLSKVLTKFEIENVCIIDRDKKDELDEKAEEVEEMFWTEGQDFEEDVYDYFKFKDYLKFLNDNYPEKMNFILGEDDTIDEKVDPRGKIYDQIVAIEDRKLRSLKRLVKDQVLKFLEGRKNAITGKMLAEYVTEIPRSYEKVLKRAVELSSGEDINDY